MFIYNVTLNLEPSIVEEWLEWMTTVHIPEVLATGYFQSYQLFKILKEDADEQITFPSQKNIVHTEGQSELWRRCTLVSIAV